MTLPTHNDPIEQTQNSQMFLKRAMCIEMRSYALTGEVIIYGQLVHRTVIGFVSDFVYSFCYWVSKLGYRLHLLSTLLLIHGIYSVEELETVMLNSSLG